ncbi:MAG TPA: hypothetical protein VFL64_20180 [Rhizobacter sp.]|nr:hypothetical protein [Rhizobacter sp.]
MQTRALVKERHQRNLLLLIDGVKTEEMLLANVVGLKPEDFKFLESLDLIAPVHGSSSRTASANTAPSPLNTRPAPLGDDTATDQPLDYAQFTATLTKLISSELGLRGFTLTLAVEKASSIEELRDVANRVLEQIRERKGLPAAEKARRSLFGT